MIEQDQKQGQVLIKNPVFRFFGDLRKCILTRKRQHFIKRGVPCVKTDRRAEFGFDLLQLSCERAFGLRITMGPVLPETSQAFVAQRAP